MAAEDKPIAWLAGEVRTPPFSKEARVEAGLLLRRLQPGENLRMPHARPMPTLGRRCVELRIRTNRRTGESWSEWIPTRSWWLVCSRRRHGPTPTKKMTACQDRLKRYDAAARGRRWQ